MKENTIKLDPAFIKQENFTDKTTFDNIQINKNKYSESLTFYYKTPAMDFFREFLTYYIDKNEVSHSSTTRKLEDFLEHRKLINQALDYIASYTKTIKKKVKKILETK
jgi:hypothetical protein